MRVAVLDHLFGESPKSHDPSSTQPRWIEAIQIQIQIQILLVMFMLIMLIIIIYM
jgi:hypothetical protein